MNALELIQQKIKRNERVTKIELAIFNNCQSIPFPKTAYDAAEEYACLLQELVITKLALEEQMKINSDLLQIKEES